MERIPSSPPNIKPLAPSPSRPKWSVMIPAYNCSQYLTQTLESVLTQHIPPAEMQIEVVDDASTDADVRAIVESVGQGRVGYYRQPENVGSLHNFKTCIDRAKGTLVHLLHGDDRVRPGYYNAIAALFNAYPAAGAAFCRFQHINEHGDLANGVQAPEMGHCGILDNWLLRSSERQSIQYATITVKREVYEKLGSFYALTYGEDWEMWVRIAKHYPVAYTPDILAEYRKHPASISGLKFLTGEYLQDISLLFRLIQNHLPPEHRKPVLKRAQKNFANYGLNVAHELWRVTQNKSYVMANLKNTFQLYTDYSLCYKAAKLVARMVLNRP